MTARLLSPVPQFNISRPCAGCPFRVEGGVRLPERTAQRVANTLDAREVFSCHETTTKRGRGPNHPAARYCAGGMLYSLERERTQEAPLPDFMALGEALGIWSRAWLRVDVPVHGSRAAFLGAHAEPLEACE